MRLVTGASLGALALPLQGRIAWATRPGSQGNTEPALSEAMPSTRRMIRWRLGP